MKDYCQKLRTNVFISVKISAVTKIISNLIFILTELKIERMIKW